MNYRVKNIHTGEFVFVGTFCACRDFIDRKKALGNFHVFRIQAG